MRETLREISINTLAQIRLQLRRNFSFNEGCADLPFLFVIELFQEFDFFAFFHGNGDAVSVENAVTKESGDPFPGAEDAR